MKTKINKVTVQIVMGDILASKADAMVYPTVPPLTPSQRLLEFAGEAILDDINQIGWCDIGEAVLTSAGRLNHRYIIHTVPPRWGEESARGKLANATWEVLRLAEENACRSLTMPPIASGAEGYPIENCAKVMLEQLIDFTFEPLRHLRDIVIYTLTEPENNAFLHELQRQLTTLRNSGDGYVSAR
jgi:O-acetyl-ADP-ribose deacetylase (regulator of RNase III)